MATHSAPITTTTAASSVQTFSKVFPTALSASKAAGIAAIRISQVNGDILLEELNVNQETTIGFRLHALVNDAKQITSIAVTQMGSGPDPLPLTPAQRSALGEIANELKEFKASNAVAPPAPIQRQGIQQRSVVSDIKAVFIGIDVGVACGAAAVEGGLNPFADAGCLAAASLESMEDSPPTPPAPPQTKPPSDGTPSHGGTPGGGAVTPGSQGGGIATVPVGPIGPTGGGGGGGGDGKRIPDGTVQVIERN